MPENAMPTPRPIGGTRFRVEHVAQTGSTNDDLLAAARAGESEGMVRVADHQTAGRGRLDRRWEAPPGASLLVSILLRPGPVISVDRSHLLTKAVALAAADACQAWTSAPIGLKWPNDLVVEQAGGTRKLAGILAEAVLDGDRVDAVVVGLGCNVAWPVDLPAELVDVAVALNHLPPVPGGAAPAPDDRFGVLDSLLVGLEGRCASLAVDGGEAIVAEFRTRCSTLGTVVRVERIGRADLVGVAIDVDADGHLLVDSDGTVHDVVVGDVVHVRRA